MEKPGIFHSLDRPAKPKKVPGFPGGILEMPGNIDIFSHQVRVGNLREADRGGPLEFFGDFRSLQRVPVEERQILRGLLPKAVGRRQESFALADFHAGKIAELDAVFGKIPASGRLLGKQGVGRVSGEDDGEGQGDLRDRPVDDSRRIGAGCLPDFRGI